MSEAEFHAVADEELEGIQDAVEIALEEGFDEEFDCNLSVRRRAFYRHEASAGLSCPATYRRELCISLTLCK